MPQQSHIEVCLHNLKLQLESIRSGSDLADKRSAEQALGYANELKKLLRIAPGQSHAQVGTEHPALGDDTNYKMYELLATFGLSSHQLLAVAHVEGLHELRKLRMLRIVYSLTLPEAQAVLAEAEKSK